MCRINISYTLVANFVRHLPVRFVLASSTSLIIFSRPY